MWIKRLVVLFLTALALGTVLQLLGRPHEVPVYQVLKTTVPIKVDGLLDDPSWQKTGEVGAFVNSADGSASDLKTKAYLRFVSKTA